MSFYIKNWIFVHIANKIFPVIAHLQRSPWPQLIPPSGGATTSPEYASEQF